MTKLNIHKRIRGKINRDQIEKEKKKLQSAL